MSRNQNCRPGRAIVVRWHAWFLVAALECQSPANARNDPSYGQIVRGAMQSWQQPGLAIGIVRGSKTDVQGYGIRNLAHEGKVGPDTLFGIGSCTKPFAAATVARLVGEGRLRWDDRVVEHLSWFRARNTWVTGELRLRDLLSNRSGLRSAVVRATAPDRRSFLSGVADAQPLHPFRAQYAYTPDMFTLAGDVVAAASGEAWADFAARTLWQPLGMTRTNADHRTARLMEDAATPHMMANGVLKPAAWNFEDGTALPSAGMNSSAHDLTRWLVFQLDERQTLVPPAALAATREAHIPLRGAFNDSPFNGIEGVTDEAYALGWFVMRYRGERVLYHHGSQNGFRCFTAIVPERGLGFVALGNSPNAGLLRALFLSLMDDEAGRPSIDWSGLFLSRHKAALASAAPPPQFGSNQ